MNIKTISFYIAMLLTFALSPLSAIAAPEALADLANGNDLLDIQSEEISSALKVIVLLTILSIIPTLMIATTSFLRIIIVLSMLRHAVGMQDTPPNSALVSIALFLTLFSMQPIWSSVYADAWLPFQESKISLQEGLSAGVKPVREFMVRQTREQDLSLMVDLSGAETPSEMSDISTAQLIPAFMLSELRTAFQIGFMVFLPFLLVDLVVASILTSLGMMMVPPITISLPLKVLMFILIDGWNLVIKSLMGSFN